MSEPTIDEWLVKRQKRQKWRDDLATVVYPIAHQRAHEIATCITRELGGFCVVEWGITDRAELDGLVCLRWSVEVDNRRSFEQRIDVDFLSSIGVEPMFFASRLVGYIQAAQV